MTPRGRAPSRRSPPLRPGFLAPGAVILPGASTNPDFDIAQNQATQNVDENAFSGRVDLRFNNNWSSYVRVFRDRGTNDEPQGVTGRRFVTEITPVNAVFNLQGLLGNGMINEFKVGYNAAQSTDVRHAPARLFDGIALSLSGTVANSGIAGQSGNSAVASPGGLVRVNSAGNGRGAPYDPYSLTFADSLSRVARQPLPEVRRRRPDDPHEHRSARRHHLHLSRTSPAFLANTPSSIQYFGDLSEPSPFHNGATGPAAHRAGVLRRLRAGRVARARRSSR